MTTTKNSSNVTVTREQFESFQRVQQSGVLNMFDSRVRDLAGLSRDEHVAILGNYAQMRDLFANPEHDVWTKVA